MKSMFTCHNHFREFQFLHYSIGLKMIVAHSLNGISFNKNHFCLFSTMKKKIDQQSFFSFSDSYANLNNVIDWFNNQPIKRFLRCKNHSHAFAYICRYDSDLYLYLFFQSLCFSDLIMED